MIFVAAGTQDGRELAGFLLERGYSVIASVVSRYGQQLLEAYKGIHINDRPLNAEELRLYLEEHGVDLLIDASHPYAANVSRNAMEACHGLGIPYLRYERAGTPLSYDRIFRVESYEEAAEKAAELGRNIFLTTGSRNLKIFKESSVLKDCRIIARVLPVPEVISEMAHMGFLPQDIVALQGPFSEKLNEELFRQYGADVIVTKNSGQIGGTDTKFLAAEALGLPVVLIERPQIFYDNVAGTFEEVLAFVRKQEKRDGSDGFYYGADGN